MWMVERKKKNSLEFWPINRFTPALAHFINNLPERVISAGAYTRSRHQGAQSDHSWLAEF